MEHQVTCDACGKTFEQDDQYAYSSGRFYCSRTCYDTLFLPCLECQQPNMAAKTNLEYYGEQLCDKCRDKKHGWSSVTIRF